MKITPYILLSIILTLFASCVQQADVEQGDVAELSFKLLTVGDDESRGNVTDYPSSPVQWSQAERAVDGRYMYTVSVYIIDNNKRIVASQENIQVPDQAEEVVVTFDKSYNLKRGIYTIMAVANNASHTINGTTYASGLTKAWSAIDYNALMNNKIMGNTTHNVSPKDMVQPLSMMKEVELHAGKNAIDGELVRTFARLRIEVKNNSGLADLKVNSLSFSNNFTQTQAYVFDDGTDRKYFDPKGAPFATSSYAIQPFALDAGSNAKSIAARSSGVVFDSYLLESKISANENYTYTLGLKYENVSGQTLSFKPNWSSYIGQTSGLSVGAESYFLIYNTINNTKYYLTAGSSSITIAQLQNNETVSTSHVWQFISAGNNQYYIKNVETGLYMQSPGNSSISLGTSPVAFTFETKESGYSWYRLYYIAIKSNNRYVNVETNGNVTSAGSSNGNTTYFRMYSVNKESTSTGEGNTITYNSPIILTTIDPVTQQSSPTKAIKRNDFINVLVTVSYNPYSGKFEFFVEGWNEGNGSVEFE